MTKTIFFSISKHGSEMNLEKRMKRPSQLLIKSMHWLWWITLFWSHAFRVFFWRVRVNFMQPTKSARNSNSILMIASLFCKIKKLLHVNTLIHVFLFHGSLFTVTCHLHASYVFKSIKFCHKFAICSTFKHARKHVRWIVN